MAGMLPETFECLAVRRARALISVATESLTCSHAGEHSVNAELNKSD
jgi:hypothetical protein